MDLLGRPRTDMVAVTMPGFGTTSRTRSNAEILCEQLGVTLRTVSIAAAVRQHFQDIGHDEKVPDVTYENCPGPGTHPGAYGYRQPVEAAWWSAPATFPSWPWAGPPTTATICPCTASTASIPKTLVRHLVRYAARCRRRCSAGRRAAVISWIPPSAPSCCPAEEDGTIAQKTEDLVGPYELHDFFLYHIVRFGFSPRKIYRLAEYAFGGRLRAEPPS